MKRINKEIDICISSPPDRDKLVAEILYGREQIIEINQEIDELMVEIYPQKNGLPWDISFSELLESLNKAKRLLKD